MTMPSLLGQAERLTFERAVAVQQTIPKLTEKLGAADALTAEYRGQLIGLVEALFFMSGETDDYARTVIEDRIRDAAISVEKTAAEHRVSKLCPGP